MSSEPSANRSEDTEADELREQRLHNAEVKLAYLEHLLAELDEVVTAQQDKLDKLVRGIEAIQRRLSAESEEEGYQ
jgi:uncharacterized coiled-coil protein SlyX